MKSSRYRELARRGAFPVLPTDGLCFFPLDMSMALDRQGPLDAVLQRLTDNLEPAGGERGEMRAVLSKEAARLQGYLAENPEICVVEPIEDWKRVRRWREIWQRGGWEGLCQVVSFFGWLQ